MHIYTMYNVYNNNNTPYIMTNTSQVYLTLNDCVS